MDTYLASTSRNRALDTRAATLMPCHYGSFVISRKYDYAILLVLYGGDIMVSEVLCRNRVMTGVLGQMYDYNTAES